MKNNIRFILILPLIFFITISSLAQNVNKKYQKYIVAKVNKYSTVSDVLKFNQTASELGAPQGQFLLRSEEGEKIIFANGKEFFLKDKLQRVHKFTQDNIVIQEINHSQYPTLIEKQVYNKKGEKLFSTEAKYLYPTGTGLFIKQIERYGPMSLMNVFGDSVGSIKDANIINSFRKIYASPDQSFFVINAGVKEAIPKIDHNRNRNRALIAFETNGNELWRIAGLGSQRQLGISNDKVAINPWGSSVFVFNRSGEELRSYPVNFTVNGAVTFSGDGRYLAAISTSLKTKERRYKDSYIYLFDDNKGELVNNWPIFISNQKSQGKKSGVPVRLAIFNELVCVTSDFISYRIYRVYNFSGKLLLEIPMSINTYDHANVENIYITDDTFQVLAVSNGLLYKFPKSIKELNDEF